MSITLKTHKMLWGRSGNRCALPNCREPLISDFEDSMVSVVGEVAHIVAEDFNGPRGNDPLPVELRNEYDNLILLCAKHHKEVDDHPEIYTIDKLQETKKEHVRWVYSLEQPEDRSRQIAEEQYAGYIDDWTERLDLDNWGWVSYLCSHGQPSVSEERYQALYDMRSWLLSRVWPRRYPVLESAFENFRRVLDDLVEVFSVHKEKQGKFYRTRNFIMMP